MATPDPKALQTLHLARTHPEWFDLSDRRLVLPGAGSEAGPLAAGFRGAKAFDVEVFEPETTNALMAALCVHDLRNPQRTAQPSAPLAHPLQLLVEGANHGGLWRVPCLPGSVLSFAALLGLMKRR